MTEKSSKNISESIKKKVDEKREKLTKISEDIEKWSNKIKELKTEISRNESILNTNLTEISFENQEFLEKLKKCKESNQPVLLNLSEPFLKRNFLKVKEVFFNDSEHRSSYITAKQSRNSLNKCKCLNPVQNGVCEICEVDYLVENEFILSSLTKIQNYTLPSYLKSLSKI